MDRIWSSVSRWFGRRAADISPRGDAINHPGPSGRAGWTEQPTQNFYPQYYEAEMDDMVHVYAGDEDDGETFPTELGQPHCGRESRPEDGDGLLNRKEPRAKGNLEMSDRCVPEFEAQRATSHATTMPASGSGAYNLEQSPSYEQQDGRSPPNWAEMPTFCYDSPDSQSPPPGPYRRADTPLVRGVHNDFEPAEAWRSANHMEVPSSSTYPTPPYGTQGPSSMPRVLVSRTNRKHKEPMRFNGKMDWSDYYSHFTAVAAWNSWSYQECGLQMAISLVDDAREVLSGLPSNQRRDFNALTTALRQRYDPEGREARYSLDLMNRTRKGGEDVAAYGYALRKLACRAYPQMPLPEQVLVNLYISGLGDKELKRYVYLARPKTLEAAIKLAVSFQGFDEPTANGTASDRNRKPKATGVSVVKDLNTEEVAVTSVADSVQSALKALEAGLGRITERLSQVEQKCDEKVEPPAGGSNRQPRQVRCYNCKELGHYANECPSPRQYRGRGAKSGADGTEQQPSGPAQDAANSQNLN